jgi:hypothetical protein
MAPLLADITLVVHLLWILFLVFGFLFALRRSRIAYVHLAGLIFALLLNAVGEYCPLTYLENHFRSLEDRRLLYSTSFIARNLESFVYPEIPEPLLRRGESLLAFFYLLLYGYWAKKMGCWAPLKKICKDQDKREPNG